MATVAPVPAVAAGAAPVALIAATSGGSLLATDGPPISLTAADGTGLQLTQLEAKAVVEGPLAFTELHLRFTNPLDRTLEGRFAITLPDGAALSRFAMRQERGWMEAEVVERMAARRAYEDFLHRRQDPALLENEAGNQFSARVFPIPAHGDKELIIAYAHEVHGSYVLPLRGLPALGSISAEVSVARPDRVGAAYDRTTFAERAWTPDRDLTVSLGAAPAAIRAGDLIAVTIDPLATASPAPIAGLTILFDTSASRALGYAAQVDGLMATVAELARTHGDAVPVTIAAFDQQVVEVYRGPARGVAAARAPLMARAALGASDLAGALRWAAAQRSPRVVVIGDAVATVGDDAALTGALAALAAASQRLDVVLVGGIRDRASAARLTRGALRDDGAIIDGGRGPVEVARRLGLTTRSGLTVAVAGARWVWPRTLDGVQPGDETVILAQLGSGATGAVRVSAGASAITVTPVAVPAPLLARAAVGVEIARLTAERVAATVPAERATLAKRIVALSTKHRVMSDLTAFLVLETEADYARFGIARTALADILTVGPAGLTVEQRRELVFLAQPVVATKQVERDGLKKELQKIADKAGEAEDGDGATDLDETSAEPDVDHDAVADRNDQPARAPGREAEERRPAAEPPPPPAPQARTQATSSAGRGASGAVASGADAAPGPAEKPSGPPPLQGEFAQVMATLATGRVDDALAAARAWRDRDPGDVLALLALGEVAEGGKQLELAARAYGSIIDLFPARADLRRFAAERLARVGAVGRALAIDALRTAVEQRPDHLTGHRLLAWELVRADDLAGAFAALERGLAQSYPADRFRGGTRILSEDLGIVAAAWIARAPAERAAITARVAKAGARVATDPTLRFVLYWETDANDVDFHITDARGDHAYYQHKDLASGGSLYEDVTTGYGPECFTIRGRATAAPYTLQIHYYARGPMGYGMGLLEVVRHDGAGHLAFEHRPYVVMVDGAFVELGTVDARTAPLAPVATLAR
ncbi:MAG: hypothetical protein IPL61_07215 [Myxococcales bacterium]|nr:hypothetical protein [Myxococcales bacterium]